MFTKTSCYHYFHSHCLGRYITHSEMELKDRERELEEDKTRDRTEEEVGLLFCIATFISFPYLKQNATHLVLNKFQSTVLCNAFILLNHLLQCCGECITNCSP